MGCAISHGRRLVAADRQALIFVNGDYTVYGCFRSTGRLTPLGASDDLNAQSLAGDFAAVASLSRLGGVPDDADPVPVVQAYDLRRAKLVRYVQAHAEAVVASPRGAVAWLGGLIAQYQLTLLDAQGAHMLVVGGAPITHVAFRRDRLVWRSGGRDHSASVRD